MVEAKAAIRQAVLLHSHRAVALSMPNGIEHRRFICAHCSKDWPCPTRQALVEVDDRCQDRTKSPRGTLRCTLAAGHDEDPLSMHSIDFDIYEEPDDRTN